MIRFSGFRLRKILLSLVVFSCIAGFLVMASPQVSSADDASSGIALTVKGNGVEHEVKFTLADLQALEQKTCKYSGYNRWPSLQVFYSETGPTLRSILDAAGLKDDAVLIRVKSSGGSYADFTREQLLDTPRYYFPDGETPVTGETPPWPPVYRSEEGKVQVPTILALNTGNGTLRYGQLTPQELTVCGGLMISSVCAGGTIEVTTGPLEQWEAPHPDVEPGSVISGTKVTVQHRDGTPTYAIVYYTLDGSEPTVRSTIFNVSYPEFQPEKMNIPILVDRDITIKAKTIGYGKLDSEVSTFHYTVGSLACAIEGEGLAAPVNYTVDTLKGMTPVEAGYPCVENGADVTLSGKGVLLSTLLDALNVSNLWEVKFITTCGEEYAGGTVQELREQQCLLAYEVNGAAVADTAGGQTAYIQVLRNLNSGNLEDNRLKYVNAIELINVADKVTISSVELLDVEGGQISSVAAGGGYCVQVQLTNDVDVAMDTLLVIQVRNGSEATATSGGSVVGCVAMQAVVDTAGGDYKAEFTLPAGLSGKAYVDVFVLDNCVSLEPLGKESHELSFDIV